MDFEHTKLVHDLINLHNTTLTSMADAIAHTDLVANGVIHIGTGQITINGVSRKRVDLASRVFRFLRAYSYDWRRLSTTNEPGVRWLQRVLTTFTGA